MASMQDLLIKRAKGDWLYDQNGQVYFDLISGFGTVFLGHCHPVIEQALTAQVQQSWSLARVTSTIQRDCYKVVQAILPTPLNLTEIYSTGMESNEFAARYAASASGNSLFIGFECSMHGKSMLTASLTWQNAVVKSRNTIILPYPTANNEHLVLEKLEDLLRQRKVAGCFVEPIRGSFDGDIMSDYFMQKVILLCEQYNCLSIFDETLTGLYRTGPRFVCSELLKAPNLLIFAKAIGNGFPISCVASENDPDILKRCLAGSTFSGNPLACAVATSTIGVLEAKSASSLVTEIESIITSFIPSFTKNNITIKGRGALWVLAFEDEQAVSAVIKRLFKEHILVSRFGNNIRLLPKLEGSRIDLARACEIITLAN